MAFEELKSLITQNVRTNGTESITGAIMQNVLLQMVNELGAWVGGGGTPYATQDWVNTQLLNYATIQALGTKQNLLVSGTNIKTINNQSILGSGNIDIQGGGGGDYLPLAGGTMTGAIEAGSISAGGYILHTNSLELRYSHNDAVAYLQQIIFDAPTQTIGFYSRNGLVVGTLISGESVTTNSFIKYGGTASQFLKADGSVDSTQYVKPEDLNAYLPLIGGGIIQSTNSPTATNKTYLYPNKVSVQYNDVGNDSSYETELNPLGLFFKETDEEYISLRRYANQIRFQLEGGDYAYIRGGGFIVDNGDNSNVILDGGGIRTLGNVGGTWLGTCTTAAATPAKTVSLSNFLLYQNVTISVRFTSAINVPNATLNVNSTGAKPIYINGNPLQYGVINAGMTATLQYDGTNWNIVSLMGDEKGGVPQYAVDLGLPSGTLWADRNVDVTQEDGFALGRVETGSYFSWGNIDGHNAQNGAFAYNWGTGNDGPYASTKGASVTANLSPQMDCVRANCGAPWRLPTKDDFQELYDNCTWNWTTQSGQTGYLIESNINYNTIFLPAAGIGYGTSLDNLGSYGYYWSSSLYSSALAYYLLFNSGGIYPQLNRDRFNGFSVRAVQ